MAFSDPISTSAPLYDSKPNSIVTPNSWWGPAISAPYPTNAWFMDFILTPNSDQLSAGDDRRTTIWPYQVRVRTSGLDVNKPFIRTYTDNRTLKNEHNINYQPGAPNFGWESDQAPATWRNLDLSLRCAETIASQYVRTYDQLSATLRWNIDGSRYMEAPIVRGMAYATMRYTTATPVFVTDNTDYHAITTVNGSAPSGTVSGTKFKMTISRPQLGVGATETWILYASSSITFTATSGSLTATTPFTGYLRLAVVATGSAAETNLDTYVSAVPISGTATASVSGNTSTTTFTYGLLSGGTLLHYSLPHHEAMLSSPTYASNHTFPTIRGTLRPVIGNSWTMTDTLSTVTWQSPNTIDSGKIAGITSALATEKTFQASNLDATEAYTFGKQISRAARLALIADQLGDTTARDSILTSMKTYLNPWLNNSANVSSTLSLVYDTTWGGVLSNNALITSPPGNPNQATEFGNAVYNDHYFHWGYYVYAAAVIAHFDSSWATTYMSKVNDIIRDIANPSPSGDPYFTQFRHLDWYEGHSWAAGLQANGDGRNQESTSEAVMAWYGINLWGLATSQPDLRNVGRYLQAAETRAARAYWQMPSTNNIYPSGFAVQKVIALVFANKVFNATWFGLGDDQIAGIQMMPFTPATHELLPKAWMTEMYPARLDNKDTVGTATTPGGWLGTTLAAKAIIDPNTAFTEIQALSTGDPEYIDKQGASKTNLLWWAAVQTASGSTPTATTTTITSANPASPSVAGTSVTFTATVSPAAAGSIAFYDGGSLINSAAVSTNTASIATSSLSVGAHTITATFTPSDSASFDPSTSSNYSYTITSSGGGSGSTGSNKNAVSYSAYSRGQSRSTARVAVSNTDYTVTARDEVIGFTSMSAARTITLPAANSVVVGKHVIVKDESGGCSGSNTITIIGTIDGASNIVLNSAYAGARVYSNGSAWFRI